MILSICFWSFLKNFLQPNFSILETQLQFLEANLNHFWIDLKHVWLEMHLRIESLGYQFRPKTTINYDMRSARWSQKLSSN